MTEFAWLPTLSALSWLFAWQATVLLGIGLVVARLFRKCPARAHRVLLLFVLASLMAPGLSYLAQRKGLRLPNLPSSSVDAIPQQFVRDAHTIAEPFVHPVPH